MKTLFNQLFTPIFIGILIILGGCETASNNPSASNATSPSEETTQNTDTPPKSQTFAPSESEKDSQKIQKTAQVYWLNPQNSTLELISSPVEIAEKDEVSPEDKITQALEELLQGSDQENHSSTIPPNVELLGVQMKPDGVHVNLSEEFSFGGGTASMTGRVAQVLYTATSLEPNGPMWLEIEGETVEVLGGEGLILEQPLTREKFEQNFSP